MHSGVVLRLLLADSPLIVYRLDDEAESRANGVDVLAHDLLYDSCLARIVQTTILSRQHPHRVKMLVRGQEMYSINILSSLSFNLAFLSMESIVVLLASK